VALGGIAAWLAKARHTFPQSVRDARWFVEELLETVREPLLILDPQLRVRAANHPFYDKFRVSPEETENRLIYQLGNGQWDIPELRTLLERILPRNTFFDDFEVVHDFPVIGRKIMRLNTHRLQRYGRRFDLILVAIEDVTERVVAEQQRQAAETRFTSMVKNLKDHAIFLLDARACITSWNEASEQILGYREDEVLGREFSFIFTEEDIQAGVPEMEMRTAVEMGRVEDERWHVRKGGPRFGPSAS
jgi:PAS domain S-box-containing protein